MISDTIFDNYFKSLLSGDKASCQRIALELIHDNIRFSELYLELFYKSMYQTGVLWEEKKISAATEHLISNVTQDVLANLSTDLHARAGINKSVVVACCAEEQHSIGAKIVADFFELNGWKAFYLGANTPLLDLLLFLEQHKPDACALSVTMPQNIQQCATTLMSIEQLFPEMDIVYGGQAFGYSKQDYSDVKIGRATHLANLEEVEMFIVQRLV